MPGAAGVPCGDLRVGDPTMSTTTWKHRQWAIVVAVLLMVIVVLLVTRPSSQPAIPRIVDEHGNNLVYQCPGDPRCTPTVAPH